MSDRCPTCDREIASADSIGEGKCEVQVSFDSKQRRAGGWNLQANRNCEASRVDWRARAIAAAARIATLEVALTEACNTLASAWSLIAAEGIAEDDERDELRRINRLRSLIKEAP